MLNWRRLLNRHSKYCCRNPKGPCAKAGGCSGSCNCSVGRD